MPAVALALGLPAYASARPGLAALIWGTATAVVIVSLAVEIVASLRRSEVGLDIVALLSMTGALLLGEQLAGVVVALMYAGGQFLESIAVRRARREMTALLERVPKSAMRYLDGGLVEVPIEELRPGDRILVRQGEVAPVDGMVGEGIAVLDESALTGEAMPVERTRDGPVLSGSTNVGTAFDLVATHPASESTYAGIVRMVEAAERAKAPMVRLADRFAIWFLLATLAISGAAWLATGDPVRWLSVMVVATPCPLILAVPVAIIAGVSRAAKRGVLVKGGGALEVLATVRTIVIDKTGTLTRGEATLTDWQLTEGADADEVIRLAASLDQASGHVIGRALVAAAHRRGLRLAAPSGVREAPGSGIEGMVEGHHLVVGGRGYVRGRLGQEAPVAIAGGKSPGDVRVMVAIDGTIAGVLVLADEIRPEVPDAIRDFRSYGVRRIVLASGDQRDATGAVAAGLQIDGALSELSPADKVAEVLAERANGPVMMVGDGVNDAPALAAADIGVAMGARGAAASSEAADAVIFVDRIDRLAEAMAIARRSRRIALESVAAGIGLSLAAMVVAAFGFFRRSRAPFFRKRSTLRSFSMRFGHSAAGLRNVKDGGDWRRRSHRREGAIFAKLGAARLASE